MSVRELLRTRPWLIAVALLVATIAWMASGQDPGDTDRADAGTSAAEPATAAATPRVQVELRNAEPVTRTLSIYGRTAPSRTVDVKAETSGRVVAVGIARGARVQAGSLIVRLDDRDRLARLEEARAVVRQRELEYDGQLKLFPAGYIPEARLAEGKAMLEAARTELRRAELDVERVEIRAPFAGALLERQVEVGDYLSEGDPVASFVDETTLVVVGSVAEQFAAGLQQDAPGVARLATGQVVQGRLRYVAPVADQATRSFQVELELDNRRGALPAGVTAQIELPVATVLAHRVSPALLTLADDGRLGVKTVDADGRVEFHDADIARSTGDAVWIAGLPDPVRVITVGQGFVRTGQLVDAALVEPQAALARKTP